MSTKGANKSSTKAVKKPINRNNQLTVASDCDISKIVFGDPVVNNVPNSTLTYNRIPISILNPDGTIGDLIMPTPRIFSFGVQENLDFNTKKPNGHVLPLCLWSRSGATEEEKQWTDKFDEIVERCKEHLLSVKEEIGQYDLSMGDLKKFNPLYYKRDKGKIVEGTGPTLYAKLISSKKHNKIMTMFFDTNGNQLDPLTIMEKYCYATAAIKFESIFVGSKITFQVKLFEATVELIDAGIKPLMNRPVASNRLLTGGGATNLNQIMDGGDGDGGSINGDEEENTGTVETVDATVGKQVEEEVKEAPKAEPPKPVRSLKKIVKKGGQ